MPNSNHLPENEQDIYNALIQIRSDIKTLKKNRETYVFGTFLLLV